MFLIITTEARWYNFDHQTEAGRGVQPCLKLILFIKEEKDDHL